MNKLHQIARKAQTSSFSLWILNTVLLRTVPFNHPHKIKIITIKDEEIVMRAKNTKNNRNHIGGVHACLLATLCEYASGLSLLLKISPEEYRIILKNINMTYHYQAKTDVTVKFGIKNQIIEQNIILPLKTSEAVFNDFTVEVYDLNGNHICTGVINWQIKAWNKVKTKIA